MIDYRVSAWAAASVVLWALSFGTIAASFAWPVANVGLLFAVAALTVTVRYWIGRQAEMIGNAFEIGRDTGRLEGGQLRGVR